MTTLTEPAAAAEPATDAHPAKVRHHESVDHDEMRDSMRALQESMDLRDLGHSQPR